MLKVRLKFDCFQMSMNKLLPIIKFNEPSKNARSVEVKYHKRNEPTLVAFFIVMLVHFDICNSIFFFFQETFRDPIPIPKSLLMQLKSKVSTQVGRKNKYEFYQI